MILWLAVSNAHTLMCAGFSTALAPTGPGSQSQSPHFPKGLWPVPLQTLISVLVRVLSCNNCNWYRNKEFYWKGISGCHNWWRDKNPGLGRNQGTSLILVPWILYFSCYPTLVAHWAPPKHHSLQMKMSRRQYMVQPRSHAYPQGVREWEEDISPCFGFSSRIWVISEKYKELPTGKPK